MGNFDQKVNKFIEIFVEQNGYAKVIQGLQNTLLIAVTGLIIGIIVGTLIATVRVLPKYKTLPKVLNGICSFYVALFRGTPMVVQLLVFYYVLLPIIGWNITGVQVAMLVFGLNSGAYISEIMRSGIQSVDAGQMEAGRAVSQLDLETLLDTVDKSTISRTITLFLSHHLIHSIDDGSGSWKYAVCDDACNCVLKDLHSHFYCERCHRTFCLEKIHIPVIDLPKGFTLNSVNYVVKGVCAGCSRVGD